MAIRRNFAGIQIFKPGIYGPTPKQQLHMNLFRTIRNLGIPLHRYENKKDN